jgi:hypothetical protein
MEPGPGDRPASAADVLAALDEAMPASAADVLAALDEAMPASAAGERWWPSWATPALFGR